MNCCLFTAKTARLFAGAALCCTLFAAVLLGAEEKPGNPACGWLELYLAGKSSELSILSPGNAYNWNPAKWGAPGPRYFGVYPRSAKWQKAEVTVSSKTGGKLELRFLAEAPVNHSRAAKDRREVQYRNVKVDGREAAPGKVFRASLFSIYSVMTDLPANRSVKIEFDYRTAPKLPPYVLPYPKERAARVMLDDFSDISSWLPTGDAPNNDPNLPHLPPDGNGFGSVPDASRDDGFSGEIVFSFVKKNGERSFLKKSVFSRAFNAGAILFSAAGNGYAARIRFDLIDADKKVFANVCEVPLDAKDFKDYRVEISPENVPGFEKMKFPVAIQRLCLLGPATKGKQTVRIDDLALEVDLEKYPNDVLKITPVYEKLLTAPGKKIVARYRVRSGLPQKAPVRFDWQLRTADGEKYGSGKSQSVIPPYGVKVFSLQDKPSPAPAALAVTLKAETGKCSKTFLGWIGVSTPNNGRKNHKPMYFGAEDHGEMNFRTEYELHAKWYHQLGIDMIRCDIYGAAFQPERGVDLRKFYRKKHQPYLDNDILINVCFTGYFPRWAYSEEEKHGPYTSRMPKNEENIRSVIRSYAEFMNRDPRYRFFEIYNEPEFAFKDTTAEFMRGMKVISETMRKNAPQIKLLSSGTVPCDWKEPKGFSEALYATTGPQLYDYAAFHAHGSLGGYERSQNNMCSLLKKASRKVEFVQTESGERSHGSAPDLCMKQADTLVKKITFAKASGTIYFNWFMLCDYGDRMGDDSFGLITVGNEPKPSFLAYLELIRELADTDPAGEWSPDGRLQGYRFTNDKEEVTVLWPKVANQTVSLMLQSDSPVELIDLFGKKTLLKPVRGLVFLTTSPHPFYLRNAKGALRRIPAALQQTERNVFRPGEKSILEMRFTNRFNAPVDVSFGGKTAVRALEPGKSATLRVPLAVPADAVPGKYAAQTELGFAFFDGQEALRVVCHLDYAVAHPVVQQGQLAVPITLNRQQDVHELIFLPELPVWQGPLDCSSVIRLSYAGTRLIVDAEVTDDSFSAPNGWDGIWVNDSLQLGISDLSGKRNLEYVLSGNTPSGNESWRFAAPEGCPVKCHVDTKFTFRREGTRHFYHAEIPLDELQVKIGPGTVLRLALIVTDNDIQPVRPKGQRLRVLKWADGVGDDKDPSKYGYLIFQ